MSLKASNKVDTNRYELEVEVDAESFEKAVQSAYLKQNKKITCRFRKAKRPASLLKNITARAFSMKRLSTIFIPLRWMPR